MPFGSNEVVAPHPGAARWAIAAAIVVVLVLAACGSAAPGSSGGGTATGLIASATAPVTSATAPAPSATAAGPARCAVTTDAAPSATIGVVWDDLGFPDFGEPVTIKAGEAVAFVNGNEAWHTVTEGTDAEPAPNACVDVTLQVNSSVVVTFDKPGVYQFTCRPHHVMQTSVTVE